MRQEKRAVRAHDSGLTEAARRVASRAHHHDYSRRGSPQARGAEGGSVEYNMELILMSTTGTAALLMLQFIDFACREHAIALTSRVRAMQRLLTDSDALTVTVPVAAGYAS
jgi:hypothetical protein